MFIRELVPYLDSASPDDEIGVAIHSVETGDVIDLTYDVAVDINEYGELLFCIVI